MLFLSIHPEYVAAIAEGTKTVELRRQVPRCGSDEWIAIYSASPDMRLEGLAKVGDVTVSSPEMIWKRWREACGVSKATFDAYFSNAKRAIGIHLKSYVPLSKALTLRELRERWPGFSPPQGFRYLTDEQLSAVPEIGKAIEGHRRRSA